MKKSTQNNFKRFLLWLLLFNAMTQGIMIWSDRIGVLILMIFGGLALATVAFVMTYGFMSKSKK